MNNEREIRIALSIPADEALARIEARGLYVQSFLFCFNAVWNAPKEKNVIVADKGENGFVLRKRHWYSNGLQPILEGAVEPAEGGSVLTAKFRRLKFVEWLVNAIMVIEAFIGTSLVISEFSDREAEITGWTLIGSTIFIVLICAFARQLGERDKPHLRAFLDACFSDVRRS